MQLIGRQMFAIDGVKLPANASKERSGTHEELKHRAGRLDEAAARIIELHQSQDATGTDPDSAKMTHQQGRDPGLCRASRGGHQIAGWSQGLQSGTKR